MKKKNLFIIFLVLASFCNIKAQQITTKKDNILKKQVPVSIYTQTLSKISTRLFIINHRLHLSSIRFTNLDEGLFYGNYFTLASSKLTPNSTNFLINDFRSFSDAKFKRKFLLKHDATKWPFWYFVYKD